ncbi:MAG: endonuclease III [Methylacidiphilales bacterium]|nr:endonuclease III [Candidatus Methylacidiphilales bacterium]
MGKKIIPINPLNQTQSRIWETLSSHYGLPKPFLNHQTPFQHLVAIILSAQSTDAMVNTISPNLFAKYGTPELISQASLSEIEICLKQLGLYRSKAKHIHALGQILCTNFNHTVPSSYEELISLPGVGRKTAHVYLNLTYNLPLIGVDTHVLRLSKRMGLSDSNNPIKVEQDLYKHVPVSFHGNVNYLLVSHGRAICTAKKPNCIACPIHSVCTKLL